jgi:hypothetical protein
MNPEYSEYTRNTEVLMELYVNFLRLIIFRGKWKNPLLNINIKVKFAIA